MQPLEDVLGSRVNIAILRHLVAIRGGLSGNEIATRLGLSESSVRQALHRLVAAGVVTRADVGNSAAYELDRELALQRMLLAPLFRAEARLHEELIQLVARAARRLKPAPQAVFLFGSLARGARDFRDIDLLVLVSRERDKEPIHGAIATAFATAQRRYKVPVSAIVVGEAELASARLASILEAVQRDGILVWGIAPAALRKVRTLDASRARKR